MFATIISVSIDGSFTTSSNIDGDTCLSGGSVALPHHYGELQMPMLGSKIECWDDNGKLERSR